MTLLWLLLILQQVTERGGGCECIMMLCTGPNWFLVFPPDLLLLFHSVFQLALRETKRKRWRTFIQNHYTRSHSESEEKEQIGKFPLNFQTENPEYRHQHLWNTQSRVVKYRSSGTFLNISCNVLCSQYIVGLSRLWIHKSNDGNILSNKKKDRFKQTNKYRKHCENAVSLSLGTFLCSGLLVQHNFASDCQPKAIRLWETLDDISNLRGGLFLLH